jgi:hypothetical protein
MTLNKGLDKPKRTVKYIYIQFCSHIFPNEITWNIQLKGRLLDGFLQQTYILESCTSVGGTAAQVRDIQSPFDSFMQTPQAFQQVRRKGMAQDRYVRRAVWN